MSMFNPSQHIPCALDFLLELLLQASVHLTPQQSSPYSSSSTLPFFIYFLPLFTPVFLIPVDHPNTENYPVPTFLACFKSRLVAASASRCHAAVLRSFSVFLCTVAPATTSWLLWAASVSWTWSRYSTCSRTPSTQRRPCNLTSSKMLNKTGI